MRLESVDNAFEQGATAALNLLGIPTAHDKVPWFWSDQYDLKLIFVGMCQGYDTVVGGGAAAARRFSACSLRGGELIAIDTVNAAKDQMAARKLIAAHARPNLDKLADAAIALRDTLWPDRFSGAPPADPWHPPSARAGRAPRPLRRRSPRAPRSAFSWLPASAAGHRGQPWRPRPP